VAVEESVEEKDNALKDSRKDLKANSGGVAGEEALSPAHHLGRISCRDALPSPAPVPRRPWQNSLECFPQGQKNLGSHQDETGMMDPSQTRQPLLPRVSWRDTSNPVQNSCILAKSQVTERSLTMDNAGQP